jgi:hypothetical protein
VSLFIRAQRYLIETEERVLDHVRSSIYGVFEIVSRVVIGPNLLAVRRRHWSLQSVVGTSKQNI